ncbi:MAG: quinone-dependent dihydroorotate dehydrogenase, partial [Bdellovibrionia bacterium]
MIWAFFKRLLFLIDAEVAHRVTISLIRLGIRLKNVPLRIVSGVTSSELRTPKGSGSHQVFGLEFASSLGLAAGFDKNAEILAGLPSLGFGFAEIGTVTPRPQPGNDRPRLFRDPARQSLFNRMGFNGLGASIVAANVAESRDLLPLNFRVGVNIGKNKDTPAENAKEDYLKAARPFEGLSDYLVINVSSPNTPGLRSLQTVDALKPIIGEVVNLISGWRKKPPLLLKLAPELSADELIQLIQVLEPQGIDGWVLTNTLGGFFKANAGDVVGGWSGSLLTELAKNSLEIARNATSRPIISVGGIMNPEE